MISTLTYKPPLAKHNNVPIFLLRTIALIGLSVRTTNALSSLPLGEINVVVLTDVHSWVAGHSYHEPNLNADYGHVLSFYEQLRSICDNEDTNKDLFFVMNGDFMDGTGLSTYPPYALVPILEHMPWDVVNVGNHELYRNDTVEYITQGGGFVQWWNGGYLTSNVLHVETKEPIGNRYKFLYGTNSNVTILSFGFLYDMKDATKLVKVEQVEDVIKSSWFVNVLSGNDGIFDAILVLAHMDVQHPLLTVILDTIRNICGYDMPVQFITGHTHYRGYHKMDNYSASFEAGRFLDTVGFVSFPVKKGQRNDSVESAGQNNNNVTIFENTTNSSLENNVTTDSSLFKHVFIDANIDSLQQSILPRTLSTPNGVSLSNFIRTTQTKLGLLDVIGCSPQTYHLNQGINESNSLWGLYLNEIIPQQLFQNEPYKVFVQFTEGAFRYDLFQGNVTVTDIDSVSSFRDKILQIGEDLDGDIVLELIRRLNNPHPDDTSTSSLPKFGISGKVKKELNGYDLYCADWNCETIIDILANLTFKDEYMQHPDLPKVAFDGKKTTTSIWSDYVSENWPTCQSIHSKDIDDTDPPPVLPNVPTGKNDNQGKDDVKTEPTTTDEDTEDYKVTMLGFILAGCLVLLLALFACLMANFGSKFHYGSGEAISTHEFHDEDGPYDSGTNGIPEIT